MFIAILGEGEARPSLEAQIHMHGLQNRVKLLGFIPTQEVLRGFDIFALPSLKEGLPYALLEARQAGLPIEANGVGGAPEALDVPLSEFTLDKMLAQTLAVYNSK